MGYTEKKVTSVPVGGSSTQFGGANAGGKHKAQGKAPRPSKVASGQGGAGRKLPSGTYKSA